MNEALKLAREALQGWMDQPDTPAAYDASMERAQKALAAIDAELARAALPETAAWQDERSELRRQLAKAKAANHGYRLRLDAYMDHVAALNTTDGGFDGEWRDNPATKICLESVYAAIRRLAAAPAEPSELSYYLSKIEAMSDASLRRAMQYGELDRAARKGVDEMELAFAAMEAANFHTCIDPDVIEALRKALGDKP